MTIRTSSLTRLWCDRYQPWLATELEDFINNVSYSPRRPVRISAATHKANNIPERTVAVIHNPTQRCDCRSLYAAFMEPAIKKPSREYAPVKVEITTPSHAYGLKRSFIRGGSDLTV